ncbi:MAG TPA: 30S ribosomal protein S12 methylthiotransferase RimO [bacterium]|nr:30S ribosomal protein S12 methylthiotransferase RimO [bacterium]
MRIGVISLGCPKNTVDTECMLSALDGYVLTKNPLEADVIVINTCAFLASARKESREAIKEMLEKTRQNTECKIVVAGCYVSGDIKELRKKFPKIHAWVGVNDLMNVAMAVKKGGVYVSGRPFVYKGEERAALLNPYSAYVKIAEGCNHKCSFCLIPSIKGKYRSRKISDITAEIERLAAAGIKEINLISQDLAYYGVDNYGKKMLVPLLKKIFKRVKKKIWVRLLYLYPDSEVIRGIAALMKKEKRLCRYVDIPFQHVNDRILKSMRRGYGRKKIDEITGILRALPGKTAVRTAFITGYPGETKAAFGELREFIINNRVDRAGVFAYSDEPGTRAYRLPGKIPAKEIRRRERILRLDSAKSYLYNNLQRKGGKTYVLVIGKKGKNVYVGRTESDAPDIDGYIILRSKKTLKTGMFYRAVITGVKNFDVTGEVK